MSRKYQREEYKRENRPRSSHVDSDSSRDPYLNEAPPTEPMRCPVCGNIYAKKRWYRSDQYDLEPDEDAGTYTCPGCRKIGDNYYFGELVLEGDFLVDHHEEISHLIQNQVYRHQEKNPLHKLVDSAAEGTEVHFKTTNPKLAEHLGRALKKAYQGELEISKSDRVTRVTWQRS